MNAVSYDINGPGPMGTHIFRDAAKKASAVASGRFDKQRNMRTPTHASPSGRRRNPVSPSMLRRPLTNFLNKNIENHNDGTGDPFRIN